MIMPLLPYNMRCRAMLMWTLLRVLVTAGPELSNRPPAGASKT